MQSIEDHKPPPLLSYVSSRKIDHAAHERQKWTGIQWRVPSKVCQGLETHALISSNRHAILRADVCASVRYREPRPRIRPSALSQLRQSVYDDRYCSNG